jgi:hypothetical protein
MNNNEFTVKSYYCENKIHFWDINRMSEYLIQMGNFSAISWEEKCTFEFIVVNGIQFFVAFVRVDIVCFTSINLQKKILKNPVFKPTFFSRCVLIYDIYELQKLISKMFVHYLLFQ